MNSNNPPCSIQHENDAVLEEAIPEDTDLSVQSVPLVQTVQSVQSLPLDQCDQSIPAVQSAQIDSVLARMAAVSTSQSIEMHAVQPQTVELDLQTDALSVKLKSVSPQQKIAELSAQVDLLSRLLNESNNRLEACLKRIGFLECKLADERRH